MKYLNISILVILLIGCQSSGRVDSESVSETIINPNAQDHWEKAGSTQNVKSLESLKNGTSEFISIRRRDTIANEVIESKAPVLNQSRLPQVEIKSNIEISDYQGPFQVASINSLLIVGAIEGDQSFEIHYSLPGNGLSNFVKEDSRLNLRYSQALLSGSNIKNIILSENSSPLLLAIEEGSNQLFERNYERFNLKVRQFRDGENARSGVEVSYGRQSAILYEGERIQMDHTTGKIEFFLLTSYSKPRGIMDEGLPNYVRLYGYIL